MIRLLVQTLDSSAVFNLLFFSSLRWMIECRMQSQQSVGNDRVSLLLDIHNFKTLFRSSKISKWLIIEKHIFRLTCATSDMALRAVHSSTGISVIISNYSLPTTVVSANYIQRQSCWSHCTLTASSHPAANCPTTMWIYGSILGRWRYW